MLSKSVDKRLRTQLKTKMKRLQADVIREDGRLERTCKHGVGHTVGHISKKKLDWTDSVHGCCGEHCCKDYIREGWDG